MNVDCFYIIGKKQIVEPVKVDNVIIYKDLIMFTDGLKTPSKEFFKRFKRFFNHFTTIQRSVSLPHFIFNLEGRDCLHFDVETNINYSLKVIKNRHYISIMANEIAVTMDRTTMVFESFKYYTSAYSLLKELGIKAISMVDEDNCLTLTIDHDDSFKVHIKHNKEWN